jgi:glucokinase
MAEEYLSTRWFIKAYEQQTGKQVSGVKELADRYYEDEIARQIFNEFSTNLGELLQHCLHTFRIQAIIIGGNISNAYSLFIDEVMKQLPANAIIKKAILGEQAAMIGATLQHKQHVIAV